MTQTDQQNVPKLRFPGFDGAWEVVPLSERVASIKSGRTKHAEVGEVPVYGSTGLIGFTDSAEFEGQNLLVARVGANAGQLNRADGRYGVTDNTLVVTPTEKIDLGFLESSLRLFNLNRLVFGSGQPLVTGTMLKRLKRAFPTLPEQRKIAGFLGAVDTKIAQLIEKKRLLEDYKKGCMQQLFSQKIRFKDDTGNDFPDWEEKRLGDIATFSKGKGISKADISEDGLTPCIRYGEIYTLYREHITDVQSATNVNPEGLFLSQNGDVIIPASGEDPLDMARACCVEDTGVALGGDINVLRGAPNGVFLAYYLNNAKRKEIASYAQGNSVVHLYASQMRNLNVSFPHPDEQRKIADFLSALDRKIDLVSQELNHARAFKQGLLQQMFV